jgi:hypothetical protein
MLLGFTMVLWLTRSHVWKPISRLLGVPSLTDVSLVSVTTLKVRSINRATQAVAFRF